MSYRLTARAERELREIAAFLTKQKIGAGTTFMLAIIATCERLGHSPLIGRPREERGHRLRSVPEGNYTIYYRPLRVGVEITRILDARRDHELLFRRR